MIDDWLRACRMLAREEADFYSGARKILRGRQLHFSNLGDDIQLGDAGYTKSKLTLLTKLYHHHESHEKALELWDRRVKQGKYGSVSFHCFNHLTKNDPNKKSKRASVMGPCIQSVVLTLPDKGKGSVMVDVFYRTTELYKKFPADLVLLRDVLLRPFNLEDVEITMHMANLTLHPMYYVTIIPHQEDPIRTLESLRKGDSHFYNWIVKWTARYICPEYHRGIQKFAQAMRVCKDANERIDSAVMAELRPYLVKHHPGYRNDYQPPEDEDEE